MNEYEETPEDIKAWEDLVDFVQQIPCKLVITTQRSEFGRLEVCICATSLADPELHTHFLGTSVVEASDRARSEIVGWPRQPQFDAVSTAIMVGVMESWYKESQSAGDRDRSARRVWATVYDSNGMRSITAYERRN